MKVSFYKSDAGRMPVWDYIHELSKDTVAHILDVLERIEVDGFRALGVSFRKVIDKLWEIRILNQRIFYVVNRRGEMVMLHAYQKQGQKMPSNERDVALKRMKEVLHA